MTDTRNLLLALTDLGDSAVLLPLGVLLAMLIAIAQSRRAGAWLLGSLILCAGLTALLKLVFMTCSAHWGSDIVSPSGHASMSATVYGAFGVIAARQASGWRQPTFLLGSLALAAVIAASRVPVGAHSPAEVALGLVIGVGAYGVFVFHYLRRPLPRIDGYLLVLAPVLAAVVLQGLHLHPEQALRAASARMSPWSDLCGWPG